MTQNALISNLQELTSSFIATAESYRALGQETLNARPHPEAWSILECLEHLNRYGDFYLPELEEKLLRAKQRSKDLPFKSGWFGEKPVQDMLPKDDQVRKMKTFSSKDPAGSALSLTTIDRFIKQQKQMLHLLEQAKGADLRSVNTRITLPVIKFKLGTTFRFVIYHNERHIWQANKTLATVNA